MVRERYLTKVTDRRDVRQLRNLTYDSTEAVSRSQASEQETVSLAG